jgi:hypothetical protein
VCKDDSYTCADDVADAATLFVRHSVERHALARG